MRAEVSCPGVLLGCSGGPERELSEHLTVQNNSNHLNVARNTDPVNALRVRETC